MEVTAAVVFLLAAFGFVGWSTSAGLTAFFSKFETDPFLRGPVFFLLLIFMSLGWRIGLRGGDRDVNPHAMSKWIVLGFFLLFGFGPLLSGRFGGGAIPGELDWIEGAKEWAWIKPGLLEATDADWLGFGVSQGLIFLSAMIGIFAWRTAELYPFAAKYPRGAKAAEGLFGFVWLQSVCARGLKQTGEFIANGISGRLWESGIPTVVGFFMTGFRRVGAWSERLTDPLTSDGYGRVFNPAAKLVQWFHGGNVRLYAWFALVWILIFSVYLTR